MPSTAATECSCSLLVLVSPNPPRQLFIPLFSHLQNNTNITKLNLQGNDVSAGGVISLCDMLTENLYITELVGEGSAGGEGSVPFKTINGGNNYLNCGCRFSHGTLF